MAEESKWVELNYKSIQHPQTEMDSWYYNTYLQPFPERNPLRKLTEHKFRKMYESHISPKYKDLAWRKMPVGDENWNSLASVEQVLQKIRTALATIDEATLRGSLMRLENQLESVGFSGLLTVPDYMQFMTQIQEMRTSASRDVAKKRSIEHPEWQRQVIQTFVMTMDKSDVESWHNKKRKAATEK